MWWGRCSMARSWGVSWGGRPFAGGGGRAGSGGCLGGGWGGRPRCTFFTWPLLNPPPHQPRRHRDNRRHGGREQIAVDIPLHALPPVAQEIAQADERRYPQASAAVSEKREGPRF